MLATRRLYFGTCMIHIHVDNIVTCENGYALEDTFSYRTIWPFGRYSITRDEILSHSDLFPDLWYSVIKEFAVLQWSDDADILPGLSGIARLFQDVYKSDYIAGLWGNDIECGLLWDVMDEKKYTFGDLFQSLSSTQPKVGPSWSWVGRSPGNIGFILTPAKVFRCRIRSHIRSELLHLRAESQVDGKNPLGRIKSATIELSGKLLDMPGVWMHQNRRSMSYWYTVSEGQVAYIGTDWHVSPLREGDIVRQCRLLLLCSCCSEPPVTMADGVTEKRYSNWREKMIRRQDYRRTFYQDRNRGDSGIGRCTFCKPGHERDAWGLLIYPAAHPGTYYRVGWFLCRAQLGGLSIFDQGYTDSITLV